MGYSDRYMFTVIKDEISFGADFGFFISLLFVLLSKKV